MTQDTSIKGFHSSEVSSWTFLSTILMIFWIKSLLQDNFVAAKILHGEDPGYSMAELPLSMYR